MRRALRMQPYQYNGNSPWLEPMLQREAVSPALRFIELIRPLGNPDVPVNRLDRRARHLGEQERDDRLRCFVRRVVAVQAFMVSPVDGGRLME